MTVKHVEQSQGVDTVLCKHKHAFTLGIFTGAAAAGTILVDRE